MSKNFRQYSELKEDFKALDEQIAQARSRFTTAQQTLQELEERRHSALPQLEARLKRLNYLIESLTKLRQLEEQYTRRIMGRTLAEEKSSPTQKSPERFTRD